VSARRARVPRARAPLARVHASSIADMHFAIMTTMPNVQVRDVPADVHRRLKSQAALAGQSLNEFLLARLSDIASVPTVPELAQRIREREPYDGPSSVAVIREDRERR
jgi:plasmid stability protein